MGGRHAKPLSLHLFEGNRSHLTKAEIEQRQDAEISLGDNELKIPATVRQDLVAKKKWNELKKLYSGFDLVTSADRGAIAELCLAYSELSSLMKRLAYMDDIDLINQQEKNLIEAELEEKEMTPRQVYKFWQKLDYVMSLPAVLSLHKAIDGKRNYIRSIEDRLFLNPLSKIKNVTKRAAKNKKEDPLEQQGFGNI